MDAIAGLAFGIVVVNVIRQMGVTDDTAVAGEVLHFWYSRWYFNGFYLYPDYPHGCTISGTVCSFRKWRHRVIPALQPLPCRAGLVILAVTITFACLKTSIGLVTSCAETFVQMFPDKLSYRTWAMIFTLFSFIVSNMGLSTIIRYSIPVLMLIYPPAISLVLLAMFGKYFHHDQKVYAWVTAFTWAASLFDFFKTLPEQIQLLFHLDKAVGFAENFLPFFNLNLAGSYRQC